MTLGLVRVSGSFLVLKFDLKRDLLIISTVSTRTNTPAYLSSSYRIKPLGVSDFPRGLIRFKCDLLITSTGDT
jgi:hypothetical protein